MNAYNLYYSNFILVKVFLFVGLNSRCLHHRSSAVRVPVYLQRWPLLPMHHDQPTEDKHIWVLHPQQNPVLVHHEHRYELIADNAYVHMQFIIYSFIPYIKSWGCLFCLVTLLPVFNHSHWICSKIFHQASSILQITLICWASSQPQTSEFGTSPINFWFGFCFQNYSWVFLFKFYWFLFIC